MELIVTKTIVDDKPFTAEELWIIQEIISYVSNNEIFYDQLVAKCKMAMEDLKKGKYDELRQVNNVMYVVSSALAEYRRTIGKGKYNTLNQKLPRRITYRVAVELFNNTMKELGFEEKIRGNQRKLEI